MTLIKCINWSMATDANGYCWLTLDRKNASANTMGAQVMQELDSLLDGFIQQPPKGLVIRSGKSNGFIAGADVTEFLHLATVEAAVAEVSKAQVIFAKLEALPCSTVAMIHGFCMGGGTELALACKYRVALDTEKTRIGLPEVLLGIQPGWGGSIRMPRLIGSIKALGLIVAGKTVDARTAAKLGLVDAAVPDRHWQTAVEYYLTKTPKPRQAGKSEQLFKLNFVRHLVGGYIAKQVAKKVNRKQYPAPFSVIDTWVDNSIFDASAFKAEARAIATLMVTPSARNLVRVFFLRDRLKSMAKKSTLEIKHVHVIGAGVMGGDIAAWCALSGYTVTVQDQNLAAIAATLQRALQLFTKRLKIPYLVQAACDRLIPDTTGVSIPRADVIIEAIIENVAAKQDVFKMLQAKAKPTAILATNTSTIPLAVIAKDLPQPQRIVGIHFFNPVALMQLVEVVSDAQTDPQVVANAMAFVGRIDKLPLPVKSSSGFLVNRVLMAYLVESALIYDEGIPGPVIDEAATDFGMLMGPIELMDTVGLDICIAAAKSMGVQLTDSVANMVAAGKLGKKTGAGFYTYKNGKPIKPRINPAVRFPRDISDRLIMRLVNEAAACLREGIVADADLVDAGLVFGAGFAPFRGGPLAYAQDEQKANILQRLDALKSRYGARFVPDPAWSS